MNIIAEEILLKAAKDRLELELEDLDPAVNLTGFLDVLGRLENIIGCLNLLREIEDTERRAQPRDRIGPELAKVNDRAIERPINQQQSIWQSILTNKRGA